MKQLQKKIRVIATALSSIFLLAFTPAHASEGNGTLPVDVQYIGFKNNSPVYQLSFSNTVADEYVVTIRDNQYNVIYTEKIKGANLTRKYQLVNEGTQPDEAIHFEISSVKNNATVKYKVNNTAETVNSIEVVKVN